MAAVPSEIVQSPLPRLKLTEIFLSLQGEADSAGWPTVFVRLTGCPLRCSYCDTAYAFHGGQWWDIDAILAEVARHGVRHVCVTGGEPLAQKRCLRLLEQLCDAGYDVSLETSGALDIADVDPRVSRVLDIKTPASQEAQRNRWENLPLLTARDQIKFVLCGRADYDWARAIVAEHRLHERCTVWFSPSKSELAPRELADWIVADRLPVRFQMQLHKLLWNDEPGR
ncbi:7-carboxy-7-deazaguanine synthase QueE [Xanthomonas translucens]|uniref:7-carboxy-7-deazaguanine synthase QueE n=1 Tax=Xanthomonas campestris pv. translucens TaxID=343 RepID=UPI0002A79169|nr:7-carboxy-7-deazaguanine synthase QueE [Xanthomonas translucens]ELP98020.1 organic radical activating enzyme protein [Xanthomonas translucens DAR61454]MBC3972044.1 7-carboxy-7-deazaguanine synthase QueE [Xanthomonas translucens pv. undulosa]MCT8281306.1 7-carboxy-7-deazaguanine synthase QueE [Xanthomonas translucens pv. undulosa]MCT8316157.1 7-carboxy-7-deazaguanine synthase QueE [Xanthomonas translucens pv. undulosa]QEO25688.1 7-carboxy-7-deazaguanine synthase QueE [Xanthomonas translucens